MLKYVINREDMGKHVAMKKMVAVYKYTASYKDWDIDVGEA